MRAKLSSKLYEAAAAPRGPGLDAGAREGSCVRPHSGLSVASLPARIATPPPPRRTPPPTSPRRCVFDLHSAALQKVPGVMGRSDKAYSHIVPSPNGQLLAMVTDSGALLLLSAKTKQLIATLQSAQAGKWNNYVRRAPQPTPRATPRVTPRATPRRAWRLPAALRAPRPRGGGVSWLPSSAECACCSHVGAPGP